MAYEKDFYSQVGDSISNIVNVLNIYTLDDIISFSNGVKDIITNEIHDKVEEILKALLVLQKRNDLFKGISLSNQSKNRAKYLDRLIDLGWIAKEYPDEVNNPLQSYYTTESGKRILSLMSRGRRN